MKSQTFQEAIQKVRGGAPASTVLFGRKKQEAVQSRNAAALLEEARILSKRALTILESVPTTDPVILRRLGQSLNVSESISHLVMANGALDNPTQDPRLKRAEEDRDPDMALKTEEVDPEELEVKEGPSEEDAASYTVTGVDDEEKKAEMNESIIAAVKRAGGRLMMEADEAPITYVATGEPTEMTDGENPVDEFGAPTAAEAEEMKNDIDNPNPEAKSAETFQVESIRRFKMTPGIKVLIEQQHRAARRQRRLAEQRKRLKK